MNLERGLLFASTVGFVVEECCECHMPFAVTRDFYDAAQIAGPKVSFHCPAGHAQHYSKSKLQTALDAVEAERKWRIRAEESAAYARNERDHHWTERKKLTTRVRNLKHRVKNGVCPCCHRTFKQLANHMEKMHPKFATDKEPA